MQVRHVRNFAGNLLLPVACLVLGSACNNSPSDFTLPACVIRVDVIEPPIILTGATFQMHASASSVTGKCTPATIGDLTWSSANTAVVVIQSESDSTATVLAKAAGNTWVRVWVTQHPEYRDSANLGVAQQVQ